MAAAAPLLQTSPQSFDSAELFRALRERETDSVLAMFKLYSSDIWSVLAEQSDDDDTMESIHRSVALFRAVPLLTTCDEGKGYLKEWIEKGGLSIKTIFGCPDMTEAGYRWFLENYSEQVRAMTEFSVYVHSNLAAIGSIPLMELFLEKGIHLFPGPNDKYELICGVASTENAVFLDYLLRTIPENDDDRRKICEQIIEDILFEHPMDLTIEMVKYFESRPEHFSLSALETKREYSLYFELDKDVKKYLKKQGYLR